MLSTSLLYQIHINIYVCVAQWIGRVTPKEFFIVVLAYFHPNVVSAGSIFSIG